MIPISEIEKVIGELLKEQNDYFSPSREMAIGFESAMDVAIDKLKELLSK